MDAAKGCLAILGLIALLFGGAAILFQLPILLLASLDGWVGIVLVLIAMYFLGRLISGK